MRIFTLLLFCFTCNAYRYEISIAAIFQNEAPFFKEWIEYHRLIGVEHFYLYNNNSTDGYLSALAPYVEEGIVDLIDWPYKPATRAEWRTIQVGAYQDAARRVQGVSRWIAYIDLDEFIFPVRAQTLPQFLKWFEKAPAVTANWLVFGTSNIKKLNPEKLMIEQLICRTPERCEVNGFVKTIAQSDQILIDETEQWDPHHVPLKNGLYAVDSNENQVKTMRNFRKPMDRIRIHHYAFRDEFTFHNVKLNRPNVTESRRKMLIDEAKAANMVEDRSILIYRDQLRKAVFQD